MSVFSNPIEIVNVPVNFAGSPNQGFNRLFFKNGWLTKQSYNVAAIDVVLDRTLDNFNCAATASAIAPTDTVLEAFQKLCGTFSNIVLVGDVTGTASYVGGQLQINTTYTEIQGLQAVTDIGASTTNAIHIGSGAAADASSILELTSTTQGFLVPRMTTTERNNIASPANGLLIYDNLLNDFYVNTGTPGAPVWENLINAGGGLTSFDITDGVTTETVSNSDVITFQDSLSINFTVSATREVSAEVLEAGVDHDALLNFVANEHIDHTTVSLLAGTGISASGLGDLTADRTINLDINTLAAPTGADAGTDLIAVYHTNDAGHRKITIDELLAAGSAMTSFDLTDGVVTETVTNGETITVSDSSSINFSVAATNTISAEVIEGGVNHDALLNFVANEHIDHTSVTITAGDGLEYTSGGADISASATIAADINTTNLQFTTGEINTIQDITTTSTPTFNNVISNNAPTIGSHLTTKTYVDQLVQGIDWKESVIDEVDFTSAEPGSPNPGDRYINTTTGTSSGTAQSVTEDYIYEWNGSTWTEISVNEGATVRNETSDTIRHYDGTNWINLGSTQSHNNLSGLQGGTSNEYYHLTASEHTEVTTFFAGTDISAAEAETLTDGSDADSLHNHSLDNLNNVTITGNTPGELLKWTGSAWINNTLAEAGIAAAFATGDLTETTSSILTITGGNNAIIGAGTTIEVGQATTSTDGYLSQTDWNTFNNKASIVTAALSTWGTDEGGGIYSEAYTHNLNSNDIVVEMYDPATGETVLPEKVDRTSVNEVTIHVVGNGTTYNIVIIG